MKRAIHMEARRASEAVFTFVAPGSFLTSASKFNIEPNGVIFDVSVKHDPRVTQSENPVNSKHLQGSQLCTCFTQLQRAIFFSRGPPCVRPSMLIKKGEKRPDGTRPHGPRADRPRSALLVILKGSAAGKTDAICILICRPQSKCVASGIGSRDVRCAS